MSFSLPTSLDTAQPFIPLASGNARWKLGGGTILVQNITELGQLLTFERANIAAGSGVQLYQGQMIDVASEPAGVFHLWNAAGAGDALTVLLPNGKTVQMTSDTATVIATSGAPTAGNGTTTGDGNYALDVTNNLFYGPKSTTWAAGVSLFPGGGGGLPAITAEQRIGIATDGTTITNYTSLPSLQCTSLDFTNDSDGYEISCVWTPPGGSAQPEVIIPCNARIRLWTSSVAGVDGNANEFAFRVAYANTPNLFATIVNTILRFTARTGGRTLVPVGVATASITGYLANPGTFSALACTLLDVINWGHVPITLKPGATATVFLRQQESQMVMTTNANTVVVNRQQGGGDTSTSYTTVVSAFGYTVAPGVTLTDVASQFTARIAYNLDSRARIFTPGIKYGFLPGAGSNPAMGGLLDTSGQFITPGMMTRGLFKRQRKVGEQMVGIFDLVANVTVFGTPATYADVTPTLPDDSWSGQLTVPQLTMGTTAVSLAQTAVSATPYDITNSSVHLYMSLGASASLSQIQIDLFPFGTTPASPGSNYTSSAQAGNVAQAFNFDICLGKISPIAFPASFFTVDTGTGCSLNNVGWVRVTLLHSAGGALVRVPRVSIVPNMLSKCVVGIELDDGIESGYEQAAALFEPYGFKLVLNPSQQNALGTGTGVMTSKRMFTLQKLDHQVASQDFTTEGFQSILGDEWRLINSENAVGQSANGFGEGTLDMSFYSNNSFGRNNPTARDQVEKMYRSCIGYDGGVAGLSTLYPMPECFPFANPWAIHGLPLASFSNMSTGPLAALQLAEQAKGVIFFRGHGDFSVSTTRTAFKIILDYVQANPDTCQWGTMDQLFQLNYTRQGAL